MAFDEKRAWIMGVVTVVAYAAYLAVVLMRARDVPLAEVAYVSPLLWSVGAGIVATILLSMLAGMASPEDCDKRDERDREITRFGEHVEQSFAAIGGVAALGMALAEVSHFWIANAIYLAFALASVLGAAAKLVAYRWGFQSCC